MDNEISRVESDTPDVKKERRNIFVRRDLKGYIRFFAAMLIVAVIVICILVLLPKKNPRVRNTGDNGLGRSFMFPFVFTDERDNLYVLEGADKVPAAIDDSVTDVVHVTSSNTVLYIRDGELYEYELSAGRRRTVSGGVKQFSMTGDGTMIVIAGEDNSIKVSRGKKVTELSPAADTVPDNYFVTGYSDVLYLTGCDQESGTADLNLFKSGGSSALIAEKISYYNPFGFSGNDKYIYCSRNSTMLILDKKGNPISEIEGGAVVNATKQAALYESPTSLRKFDANGPLSYIYAASDQSGSLLFFTGKTVKTVTDEIRRIIYAAPDHSLIIYTVAEGDGERICRADKKGNSEKLIYIEGLQRSLYDADTNHLYYQTQNGELYRVNIYSSSLNSELISEISANIYKYPEKPFVMFTIPDSDIVCLITDGNTIEQFSADEQARLYGAATDKYLLLRSHGYGEISLDLAESEYYKRISQAVDTNVVFDSTFDNVLYVSGNTLYIWTGGNVREVGNYSQVRAADIA